MNLQIEHIITILAVAGSALTIYFNLKKFGDNIKTESEWRTTVNRDIRDLIAKVDDMICTHKNTVQLVHDLLKENVSTEHQIKELKNEIDKIWKSFDDIKDELKYIRNRVSENR